MLYSTSNQVVVEYTSHLTSKQQLLGTPCNPSFIIVNIIQATRLIWAVWTTEVLG